MRQVTEDFFEAALNCSDKLLQAERELAEARKALMWTATAFAEQPGPDIPKDVRAAYVAARALDAKEAK